MEKLPDLLSRLEKQLVLFARLGGRGETQDNFRKRFLHPTVRRWVT